MAQAKEPRAEKDVRVKKRKEIMDGRLRVTDMVITDEFVLASASDSIQKIVEKMINNPGDALLIAELEDNNVRVKGIVTEYNILKAIADGLIKTELISKDIMSKDIMEVKENDALDDILSELFEKQPQAVIVTNEEGTFKGYFSPTDCELASARLKFFED